MTRTTGYIIDASVVVKWLNQDAEQHVDKAMDLLRSAVQHLLVLTISDLTVHEVLNALIRGKQIRDNELARAIEIYFDLPLVVYTTTPTIAASAALIAQRLRITFYDAVYLAIASETSDTLITANPKHQRPFGQIHVLPLEKWNESAEL